MRKYPVIKGSTYQQASTFDELEIIMDESGWTKHDLGTSAGGYPLIGYSYGDIENKPVIYFQGNIHGGHEWNTVHHLADYMKDVINPPDLYKQVYMRARQKFAFYCIPSVNPDGYFANTYRNANGVNLNRNFPPYWDEMDPVDKGTEPFSEPEAKAIQQVVLQYKPISFWCWHTWGAHEGSKVYSPTAKYPQTTIFYEDLADSFRLSLLPDQVVYDYPTARSQAFAWAATIESRAGFLPLSILGEIGGGLSKEKQNEHSRTMHPIILDYITKWFETRTLPIT